MKRTYDVKVWIQVRAETPREAQEKAAAILDLLPERYVAMTSVEGEGAVYEVEEEN